MRTAAGGTSKAATWRRQLSSSQLFVASFALLILLGTLALSLPGMVVGPPLSWLDALFTVTSAVCVTGLTVADTGTRFTFLGQVTLLVLIQLGGLGIIAFTSLIFVLVGRRLSLRAEEITMSGTVEAAPHLDARLLIRNVILFTFALEFVGASLLYLAWGPRLGWDQALWPAVFHAISAFCNAGFSIFPDNLAGYRDSPLTLACIGLLVIVGGLGFITLEEFYEFLRPRAARRRAVRRLSLHSQIVLATTLLLIVAGTLLYALLEWQGALAPLSWQSRWCNAWFCSVTARTAGFNTIDYTATSDGTNFFTILLMAIGGSPGSTAGGIKTTTAAVIGLVAWARLRGDEVPGVWNRSLREEKVEQAIGLFALAFGVTTVGVFLLTLTEAGTTASGGFLARMFTAVSAFNTVGLDMGLTARLTPLGKLICILMMFLGRIGPVTVVAAFAARRSAAATKYGRFRYAYEDVLLG